MGHPKVVRSAADQARLQTGSPADATRFFRGDNRFNAGRQEISFQFGVLAGFISVRHVVRVKRRSPKLLGMGLPGRRIPTRNVVHVVAVTTRGKSVSANRYAEMLTTASSIGGCDRA